MEFIFIRFALLASCLAVRPCSVRAGPLSDHLQGRCRTDSLHIRIAKGFMEAHNVTVSVEDKNALAHPLGPSLDAKCGYKQRRNYRGDLEVTVSLMACHVYLEQKERLVFNMAVTYVPRDASSPPTTEVFSFSCHQRLGSARRRVLCEEKYIEVSLNIDVPFHYSTGQHKKAGAAAASRWYFDIRYPDGSTVTRDQKWVWSHGIGVNTENMGGWITLRVPHGSPIVRRKDYHGYPTLGYNVVAKHEELLTGLRYNLSAVCPIVKVSCEGNNVTVAAVSLRLPGRASNTENLALRLQLDGLSLSQEDTLSRGYSLQLRDKELRASFGVLANPLVREGSRVMNRHQLSLVHVWRDRTDQRNTKAVIFVPGHTCSPQPPEAVFTVKVKKNGFNITYGPVPKDYTLSALSIDGVLFQSVEDLPWGVTVRLVQHPYFLYVRILARFGSRLVPRKYVGGFTSQYSVCPALIFKTAEGKEEIVEEKEPYNFSREDIVLPVLEGFCGNGSVCFNVTRGNADNFWSFHIWDAPFLVNQAAQRGHSYTSRKTRLVFCVSVDSPDLLHQRVTPGRRTLLLAVSFRDRAKGGVMVSARQSCTFPSAGELECTEEGLLKASGLRLAASPSAALEQLTVRDPKCGPSEVSRGLVSFSFPVNTCGTTEKVQGRFVEFENKISNQKTLDWTAPEYLRFHATLLCRYRREELLTMGLVGLMTPRPPLPARGNGNLTLRMDIMRDSTFSSAFTADEFPVARRLREPVFVQVMVDSEDPGLELFLRDCWGTLGPQPTHPITWPIIQDSCELQEDEYRTVFHRVRAGSTLAFPQHHKRFEVKTFAFVKPETTKLLNHQIYFHCSVILCDTAALRTDEACSGDCIPHRQRRGRRSGSEAKPGMVVSAGSIELLPLNGVGKNALDPRSLIWLLSACLAAVLCLLAGLVCLCLRHKKK
ncbi:uncharacterized protein LOC136753922 isoform X2 [Amia ocellicauda]|uniref:uncharacterized protein LOC136753922 isoform X2 n=1 Tax=Amia ocellicauda TaxID=2972642 RepID=UPI003463D3CC